MAHISLLSRGKRLIHFDPVDFLVEAIEEFLESGARPRKIASCVIKIATATELLLKEKLAKICPALILDAIDDQGLQIAKLYSLSSKLLNPRETETLELKTAPFPKLLRRFEKFFDLNDVKISLTRLHQIRNSLLHHKGEVDVLEVNLLLIQKVFPFLEQLTKGDKVLAFRLKPGLWQRLRELERQSVNAFTSELAKKIAHHEQIAKRLSKTKVETLLKAAPETQTPDETVIEDGLRCPACQSEAITTFMDVDVDSDEDGVTGAYPFFTMRCKVCGLDLDREEIEHIINNFGEFFGAEQEREQYYWKQSIEPPGPEDEY